MDEAGMNTGNGEPVGDVAGGEAEGTLANSGFRTDSGFSAAEGSAASPGSSSNRFSADITIAPLIVGDAGAVVSDMSFSLESSGSFDGGQASVRKAVAADGSIFAVKIFNSREAAETEWRALRDYHNFALLPEGKFYGEISRAAGGERVGSFCVVMEWIDGETVAERIGECGRLTVEQSLRIMSRVIEFCSFSWDGARKRLVHHDVKPSNIILEQKGLGKGLRARLIDFGVSYDPAGEVPPFATQGFAAPEMFFASDKGSVGSNDSFSIAATLLSMLCGEERRFPAYGVVLDENGNLSYDSRWTDDYELELLRKAYYSFETYVERPREKGLCIPEGSLNSFEHNLATRDLVAGTIRQTLEETYGKFVGTEEASGYADAAFRAMDRKIKACLAACLSVDASRRPKPNALKAGFPASKEGYLHELRIIGVNEALGGGTFAGGASVIDFSERTFVQAMEDYNSGFYGRCLPVFDRLARQGSHTAKYNIAVMIRDGLGGADERYTETDLVQLMGECAQLGSLVAQNWYGQALYGGRYGTLGENKELGLQWIRESARDDKRSGRQGFRLAKEWLEENGK